MKARTLSSGNAEQYVELVRESGLPLAGLLTETECFEFYDDQDAIVGFAGVQRVGVDGLLRSLVIFPARRKAGFGSATPNLLPFDLRDRESNQLVIARPAFLACSRVKSSAPCEVTRAASITSSKILRFRSADPVPMLKW
jgi:hypothetical protein